MKRIALISVMAFFATTAFAETNLTVCRTADCGRTAPLLLPDGAVVIMDMHRESIGVQNGARIAPASGYPANVSQGAREAWARKHPETKQ